MNDWRSCFMLVATLSAQSADTVDSHVAAAKALAAADPTPIFNLCTPEQAARATPPPRRGGQAPVGGAAQPARGPQAAPDRSRWAREPMKVFDNLYYVGEREYSSWAVTTSAGIIIIDPIYDYSVEEQVVGGLKKLGLDPAQINMSSSACTPGSRKARMVLAERFVPAYADGARLGDARAQHAELAQPKRDMVVADRQK